MKGLAKEPICILHGHGQWFGQGIGKQGWVELGKGYEKGDTYNYVNIKKI